MHNTREISKLSFILMITYKKLKSPPSYWYVKSTPGLFGGNIAASYKESFIGAKMHSCFSPHVIGNSSDSMS